MTRRIFILALCFGFYNLLGQENVHLVYKIRGSDTNKTMGRLEILSYQGDTFSKRIFEPGNFAQQFLTLKHQPNFTFMIGENKTYLRQPEMQLSEYVVKVLGKEKVNGFECTKLALSTHSIDDINQIVWISSQVPDYINFTNVEINNIYHSKLNMALEKINLSGLIVKAGFSGKESSVEYELEIAELKEFDHSKLDLSRYVETNPMSKEELLKNGKISGEQYKAMEKAEKDAIRFMKNGER